MAFPFTYCHDIRLLAHGSWLMAKRSRRRGQPGRSKHHSETFSKTCFRKFFHREPIDDGAITISSGPEIGTSPRSYGRTKLLSLWTFKAQLMTWIWCVWFLEVLRTSLISGLWRACPTLRLLNAFRQRYSGLAFWGGYYEETKSDQ